MVDFFIDRPIFAAVLAILITLAGARLHAAAADRAVPADHAAHRADRAPATPGASAEVVESTVTVPIEEQVNGAEGMLYMSSTSVERRQHER